MNTNVTTELTIAYATYNRKNIIRKRLLEAINLKTHSNLEIIFIDNNSSDGTYEELKKINTNNEIKIFRNSNNLGFSGNFIQTFIRSSGKYVYWVSDEDAIHEQNIDPLILYLKENKPDCLILNHYKKVNDKFLGIRTNNTRLITENDLWNSCHLPGGCWSRQSVLNIYKNWQDYLNKYSEISKYYPNLIFLVNLIPNLNTFYYNFFLTYQKDFIKSSHDSTVGKRYCDLSSRWKQHNEIIKLIDNIKGNTSIKNTKSLTLMKENLNKNIYSFLSNSIYEENKEIYYHFSRSFFPSYIIRRNYTFLVSAIKKILDDPHGSYNSIKNRLRTFFLGR